MLNLDDDIYRAYKAAPNSLNSTSILSESNRYDAIVGIEVDFRIILYVLCEDWVIDIYKGYLT